MNYGDMINRVKVLLPNIPGVEDTDIAEYLSAAGDAIMDRMYPFADHEDIPVPAKYHGAQCELAARYISRAGGLGQTGHEENGIARTWDSPDDVDILNRIMPRAKVVG